MLRRIRHGVNSEVVAEETPKLQGTVEVDETFMDAERVSRAIKQAEGKRLKYREWVDNPPYLVQPEHPDAPF